MLDTPQKDVDAEGSTVVVLIVLEMVVMVVEGIYVEMVSTSMA